MVVGGVFGSCTKYCVHFTYFSFPLLKQCALEFAKLKGPRFFSQA